MSEQVGKRAQAAVEPDPRIIELGVGTDAADPRATATADLYARADHVFDLDEDWPIADASVDGLIASHVLEHVDLGHALDEAARVLRSGGWLEVAFPIGRDFWTDTATPAGHRVENVPAWHKPEVLVGDPVADQGRRHWDPQRPLTVVYKDVDLWTHARGVRRLVDEVRIRLWMARHGPGRWCFDWPMTSGEFTVIYRREEEVGDA